MPTTTAEPEIYDANSQTVTWYGNTFSVSSEAAASEGGELFHAIRRVARDFDFETIRARDLASSVARDIDYVREGLNTGAAKLQGPDQLMSQLADSLSRRAAYSLTLDALVGEIFN